MLNVARESHTISQLNNRSFLVTGGVNGAYLKSAEVYDSATGVWTPVANMNMQRAYHTATVLNDGIAPNCMIQSQEIGPALLAWLMRDFVIRQQN
jgi:hypothetical protein